MLNYMYVIFGSVSTILWRKGHVHFQVYFRSDQLFTRLTKVCFALTISNRDVARNLLVGVIFTQAEFFGVAWSILQNLKALSGGALGFAQGPRSSNFPHT